MKNGHRLSVALLALSWSALRMASAAPAGPPGASPTTAPIHSVPAPEPPARVTRADVAAAYLAFERAYRTARLDEAQRQRIGDAFDRATLRFFGGQYGGVVEGLHELLDQLSATPASDDDRLLRSLRASVEPPTIVTHADGAALKARLTTMYPIAAGLSGRRTLAVKVHDASGTVQRAASLPVDLVAGEQLDCTLALPMDLRPGACETLRVTVGCGAAEIELARVAALPEAPGSTRERMLARLASGAPLPAELRQAAAAFRARVALLSDEPSSSRSSQYLLDRVALRADLERELDELLAGRNPYARPGDVWRVVEASSVAIPIRVFVPEGTGPFPVVIALHGAGGDENMFMEGYGAGRLKELAAEHRFIAVSPATLGFGTSPLFLDALIAMLADEQAIDRSRIFLLGHSMGAGAAARLVGLRSNTFAAYACLAGFGSIDAGGPIPPGLLVVGERDAIVPTASIVRQTERLRAAGIPIEVWSRPNAGHTLIVADELSQVVDWLLTHSR